MAGAFDWRADERVFTRRPSPIAVYGETGIGGSRLAIRQKGDQFGDQAVLVEIDDSEALIEAIARVAGAMRRRGLRS